MLESKKRDSANWQIVALAKGGVMVAVSIAKQLELSISVLNINDYYTKSDQRLLFTPLGSGNLYGCNGNGHRAEFIPDINENFSGKRFKKAFAHSVEHHFLFNSREPFKVPENIILVDDGVNTGRSARTSIASLRLMIENSIPEEHLALFSHCLLSIISL